MSVLFFDYADLIKQAFENCIVKLLNFDIVRRCIHSIFNNSIIASQYR